MRKISADRYFHGTYRGCSVSIERESDGRIYIIVKGLDGGSMYDGWAPDNVNTIDDAKREAIRGSCL